MRITSALLCLSLLSLSAAAALPGDTGAYLAARDRYIAEYKLRPGSSPVAQPLADLERRLKAIIPRWQSPGFPTEGRINLCCLQQDLGFGMLDGLRYRATGTEVIVTTPELVRNWIADHAIPQPFDAAIRSGEFWTFARGDDNGWVLFGEVPVRIAHGEGAALLVAPTQTGYVDGGPSDLFVAVSRDDRVFIASQKMATVLPGQPVCARLLRTEHKSDDQVASDFQACFSPHLQQKPQYAVIQKQAQALADLLH